MRQPRRAMRGNWSCARARSRELAQRAAPLNAQLPGSRRQARQARRRTRLFASIARGPWCPRAMLATGLLRYRRAAPPASFPLSSAAWKQFVWHAPGFSRCQQGIECRQDQAEASGPWNCCAGPMQPAKITAKAGPYTEMRERGYWVGWKGRREGGERGRGHMKARVAVRVGSDLP